jgi:hypothetical protein
MCLCLLVSLAILFFPLPCQPLRQTSFIPSHYFIKVKRLLIDGPPQNNINLPLIYCISHLDPSYSGIVLLLCFCSSPHIKVKRKGAWFAFLFKTAFLARSVFRVAVRKMSKYGLSTLHTPEKCHGLLMTHD